MRIAARNSQPVLLTGRTGTGKDLVARAIHQLWEPGAPFVAHNCALTPSELFDGVFFGHSKGAFTGADQERVGLLQAADHGLFFLDELEAMDVRHQAKLLRVLDEGEVRPLGHVHARRVDVRFVAATNRDPIELIRAGTLREDLYWRLRGEIHLPLSPRARGHDLGRATSCPLDIRTDRRGLEAPAPPRLARKRARAADALCPRPDGRRGASMRICSSPRGPLPEGDPPRAQRINSPDAARR